MRPGEVYVPSFTWVTGQYWLQEPLPRGFPSMISGASSAAMTEVLDVSSPLIPEKSSLYLVDGLSLAGVSPSTTSVTSTDDFLYIGSRYQELRIVPFNPGVFRYRR